MNDVYKYPNLNEIEVHPEFVRLQQMMNDKAKALGLKNTNFKNAVGLDEENHYSSAYDMAVIASNLVKYEKSGVITIGVCSASSMQT